MESPDSEPRVDGVIIKTTGLARLRVGYSFLLTWCPCDTLGSHKTFKNASDHVRDVIDSGLSRVQDNPITDVVQFCDFRLRCNNTKYLVISTIILKIGDDTIIQGGEI